MDFISEINNIITDVFKIQKVEDYYETELKKMPNFDSMRYIELISRLEKKFNTKLSFQDIMKFNTVKDIFFTFK